MNKAVLLLLFLCIACLQSKGQYGSYKYIRPITSVSGEWNKIVLPAGIYEKTLHSFNDIRIVTVNKSNDTIEVPFLLQIAKPKQNFQPIAFKKINESFAKGKHYFTFETDGDNSVSEITLALNQENFDWRTSLQGSNDNSNWFDILNEYRILGIKNANTNYRFTKLDFKDAKFKYYRIGIASTEKPLLTEALINHLNIEKGISIEYPAQTITSKQNIENSATEIDIKLFHAVPISFLKLIPTDKIDYYRPIQIAYAIDSTKISEGEWRKNYNTVFNGTLSSIDTMGFQFDDAIARDWKLTIDDGNNKPLNIEKIEIKGLQYSLVGRFTDVGKHFLVYGNRLAAKPNYDIIHFREKIPKEPNTVIIGDEIKHKENPGEVNKSAYFNKFMLWAILLLLVVILSFFAYHLLKNIN